MSWLTSIFSATAAPAVEDDIHFSPLSLSRTPSSVSISSHTSGSEFELISSPAVATSSPTPAKISFLNALMRSKPDNHSNKVESPFMCYGAEIQRCPSTSTTPADSLCSSRCESPFSQVSSLSDDERKEYDFANSATVSDVESMDDSDDEDGSLMTDSGMFPSIAEENEEEIEEEEEPFHFRHLWEDCEGEFDNPWAWYHDSYLIHSHRFNHGRTSRMLMSASWEFDRSLKTRHKAISHFKTAWDPKYVNKQQRAYYARAVNHHVNPRSLTRLQEASAPVNHLQHRRQVQVQQCPIPNPYQREQSHNSGFSSSLKHKNASTASVRAAVARIEACASNTVSRRALQRSAHSLSASTRPALVNVRSEAHKIVLINRAARKEQLKKPNKKRAVPRAMLTAKVINNPARKHASPFFKQTAPHTHAKTTPRQMNKYDTGNRNWASDMTNQHNFDDFRREFYKCFRSNMEHCMDGSTNRVTNIRQCPINSNSQYAFMQRLVQHEPKEYQIECVYHGSPVQNMQSIINKGLLAPTATSGISPTHASGFHGQIYSYTDVYPALNYAKATSSTLFVCAIITTKCTYNWENFYNFDGSKYNCLKSGSTVIIQDEKLIIPAFLLDFEVLPPSVQSHLRPLSDPTKLAPSVARTILRRTHDKQKRQNQLESSKQLYV